ncbi:MAG: hypothetical protein ACKOYN_10395 [Planctomycetota bacterium]
MILRPLIAACILAASLAGTAVAQQLDRAIIAASAPLTEAQKSAVGAFASNHLRTIREMPSGSAVNDARTALVSPMRDPAATASFRKGMAQVLVAELGPVAKGSDLRAAVVAMQVLRFTRSPEAIDVLVDRATPSAERDPGKRVSAGSLAADAFEDLDANNAFIESAARKLRDAAVAETDWLAMQQKLAAIGSAARRGDLSPDSARKIRLLQVDAISGLSKAIAAAKEADPRMQAVHRALIGLRNDLLTMKEADRSALAKPLAAALAGLMAAGAAQWDSAHANPTLSASYSGTMNLAEVMLRLIDRGERPSAYAGTKPDSDSRVLAPAWDAKDKAKFEAEAKRWAGIVAAAPYK